MPRAGATSAISRHLWNQHGRTRSEGTLTERELLHEELHAVDDGTLTHQHGANGEFVVVCPCGHQHECTVLASKEN
jgi:hypothetical protein